jgi:hypothetical protein
MTVTAGPKGCQRNGLLDTPAASRIHTLPPPGNRETREAKMKYQTFYQVTYWRVSGTALSLDYTSQYLGRDEDLFLDAIALAQNIGTRITTQICERGVMREHDANLQAAERAIQAQRDELLAALKEIQRECEADYPMSHGGMKLIARDAIRKAESDAMIYYKSMSAPGL